MVIKNRSSISSLLLVLGAFSAACGDDSGDEPEGGTTGSYESTLVPITADNASTPITTPHMVSLLNDRGEPLSPPVTTTTGTDGKVVISERPADGVSIYVQGVGPATTATSTYDTIVANHNWDSGETLLRISSAGTLMLAEQTSGFTANADRAALSGAVYWTTDGKRRLGPVGCAKLYIDGQTAPDDDQAQRYIGDNPLPVPLATRDSTTKTRGQFYFGNMKTGSHTIKVSLDNGATFIAEKTFYVGKTRAMAASPTKSVIYQLGIDTTAPANPTLATCQ